MMAEELGDGEFWLPPQFLSEDELLKDFNKIIKSNTLAFKGVGNFYGENDGGCDFPYGFGSYGPNSDLSSPVESVLGSTETESDEDDYLTGLTRKFTQSTLSDNLWKVDTGLGYENTKSWSMAGSPQSTLCNVMGGGCGCKQGSSCGSPSCPSPPPSASPLNKNEPALDLLYAAAGEVARMRMVEGAAGFYPSRGLLGPHRKPRPVSGPLKHPINPNLVGFHTNQSLSCHQLQFNQQLKQQQMLKQHRRFVSWGQPKSFRENLQAQQHMVQNRPTNSSNGRLLGLYPSAWPTLQQSQQQQPQQQHGTGVRAVFLENPGSKRECVGTGVFLPRRIGTPIETRKKTGCSTVLLPDRVVQALNLSFESMDSPPQFQTRSNNAGFSPDYDAAGFKYSNNVLRDQAHQRRNVVGPQPVTVNNEVRLPQEWTY